MHQCTVQAAPKNPTFEERWKGVLTDRMKTLRSLAEIESGDLSALESVGADRFQRACVIQIEQLHRCTPIKHLRRNTHDGAVDRNRTRVVSTAAVSVGGALARRCCRAHHTR